jgi:uncharacterized membrane protein (DUF2068 family)
LSAGEQGELAVKRRAPTLYAIAAIKLIKGSLLLLLALGVYSLSDNNLPEEFRSLLKFLHLDPEQKFFADLAARIGRITPANVYWVAAGTAFYSLFSLVEGVGLTFRISWAGWMAISESGFFIPIEVYDLVKHFSVTVSIILAINIVIVWYLLQNRHRLFRHHHH